MSRKRSRAAKLLGQSAKIFPKVDPHQRQSQGKAQTIQKPQKPTLCGSAFLAQDVAESVVRVVLAAAAVTGIALVLCLIVRILQL